MPIKIICGANSLPKRILHNSDLAKMVDTTDEWIVSRVGIRERRIYGEGESALQSMIEIGKEIIQKAGIEPNDISLVIVGSATVDYVMPSSAGIIQGKLGIAECVAFDLQAACSGFVYACNIAYNLMRSDPSIKYALVFGAETLSKVTNWKDRSTCVLFGDGAGGVLLANNSDSDASEGIVRGYLGSDGQGQKDLGIPWGVGQGYDRLTADNGFLSMNGREVFLASIKYFVKSIYTVFENTPYALKDVDWIVPHQANIRIIDAVAEKINFPKDKIVSVVDLFGNTSAASIVIAFNHFVEQGKIKKGQLILFIAFGAGYTWGSLLFRC